MFEMRKSILLPGLIVPVVHGQKSYLQRALSVRPSYMIQALPLDDAAGQAARDLSIAENAGSYFDSNGYGGGLLTFQQEGPSPETYGVEFTGDDSGLDMVEEEGGGNNDFGGDWNGNLYSAICWMKVDAAARWTDLTTFRYGYHVRAAGDATYYSVMAKNQTNHQIEWRRRTGGPITSLNYTFNPAGPTDWFCMGITFDQSKPLLSAYLWDSADGFQAVDTSESVWLVDWGNNPPTAGTSIIGAGSLTLQEWLGFHSLTITWAGIELSAAEMRKAMTP